MDTPINYSDLAYNFVVRLSFSFKIVHSKTVERATSVEVGSFSLIFYLYITLIVSSYDTYFAWNFHIPKFSEAMCPTRSFDILKV